MARRQRWAHSEEGSAIAELVIVAPVLLIVIVLMVALGRVDSAQGDVESAARAGVQAAVVQSDPSDAETQATSLADVSVPGVPGAKTLTATSTAHIDPFRAISSQAVS